MIDKKTLLLIPNGTQIVTLVESKVMNEARFHQKGTVGKIKAAPIDATHSYLIEFLDGSICSLKRNEFSIRKEYQTGIAFNAVESKDLNNYIIYRCIVGSRTFGLDDEHSDTDYRGIYLPPANLHWSLYGVPEQIENKEKEECFWELQKFLILALKANPNILECLNTPLIEYANDIAREAFGDKTDIFLEIGLSNLQRLCHVAVQKLEQDLRTSGEVRPKHAMHLIRLLLQGIEILKAGELDINVLKHREQLLSIKRGELSREDLNVWRLKLHTEFEKAFAETRLPERPDYEKANNFLLHARKSMIE